MHPKNKHFKGYDFGRLIKGYPPLGNYARDNGHGRLSIDYANAEAVLALNTALLLVNYGIDWWTIPEGHLCPPIPGRADYLLHIADFLSSNTPFNAKELALKGLEIGTGASTIYPLLGQRLFNWSFVGSDILTDSLSHAQKIVSKNSLTNDIEIRRQAQPTHIFDGLIKKDDYFDFSLCNPPFHASADDTDRRTRRKWKNLGLEMRMEQSKSFSGKPNELWVEGGERSFVEQMIQESQAFGTQVLWFSSLVSRKSNLPMFEAILKSTKVSIYEVIPMGQGQKSSRILLWSFLDKSQRDAWKKFRWESLKKR